MKAVLEIGIKDLNMHLVEILNALFEQDVTEVVLRKNVLKLEEFDRNLTIQDVMFSLKEYGHNELLLKDIEDGLKNSSIYSKR
ncbi:MAG: hypothetical protein HW421_1910 [Ignavibacteria bacterium]|nr:hypothetical protein [Ignavibacteria bacterium]